MKILRIRQLGEYPGDNLTVEWRSCGRTLESGAAAAGVLGGAPSAKQATCSKTSTNRRNFTTTRQINQLPARMDPTHADQPTISPNRVQRVRRESDPALLPVPIRGLIRPCLNSDVSASTNPCSMITYPTVPMISRPARIARERLYSYHN